MLITKEVETGFTSETIKLYEEKGYKIPRRIDKHGKLTVKMGTKIIVNVNDLPRYSSVLVNIECDGCGEILENIKWQDYLKCVKEDGKYYCNKCARKLFGEKKYKETRLKNGKSFYQWCYDNLSKELADYILSKWDYELNIDSNGNKLTPMDVTYGSHGLDGSGYWFKCLDHPEHKSELKNIHGFTNGQYGSINCNMCNMIVTTHPKLVRYFINKEDIYKYSAFSSKKIPMKCPDCGYEKNKRISGLTISGFACPKCGDGVSYPEKFMFNVFEQLLDKDFQIQLSKTSFNWCGDYKYDNYIEKINSIIETGGLQHYEENHGNWKMSLDEIQINDFDKEWLARENKIKNYIIIDCRKSEIEWIKDSIMNSKLPKLLDFKEDDIDWLKCHEYACNSLVKMVCDLWNKGIKIIEIANKLKIGKSTTWRYLTQGTKLGWCNYSGKEEIKKKNSIKVICLTTGEVFDSVLNASNKYNLKSNANISGCCKYHQKSAGKLPDGTPLKWMYYDEYIKLNTPLSEELSIIEDASLIK